MKITAIEISKFKAFYGAICIDLTRRGKNLLVYGENGSGKSSLYEALNLFFITSSHPVSFNEHRNIFTPGTDGHVRLHLRETEKSPELVFEWSPTLAEASGNPLLLAATKARGFLDYKSLLETHFLHRKQDRVNVFDLIVHELLSNTINDVTGRPFIEDWETIINRIPDRNTPKSLELIEESIAAFNTGLATKLVSLQETAEQILAYFGFSIKLTNLRFQGVRYNQAAQQSAKAIINQEILLEVQFFDVPLRKHHKFLNEAKLSAIALSIYLASLLLIPPTELKVLVLDDVLIGLDMSNRLPAIDILREYFSDYQIIITTFDRTWFEMVRMLTKDDDWAYIELFTSQTDSFELPVFRNTKHLLDQAEEYLQQKDYKACVIYLRTAFEVMIEKYCDKKRLPVRFRANPRKLTGVDFWEPVKIVEGLDQNVIQDIELYRTFILNPLSHAAIMNIAEIELRKAKRAIENLQTQLNRLGKEGKHET